MYPFIHLLKDGNIFVFASHMSQIFDAHSGEIIREMPDLPGMHRTYPNTGGSVMLPLTAENDYEAEIMICGGGYIDSEKSPTDGSCGIIQPTSADPAWRITKMPGGGRIMVEGVLLLDGTVLWLNGARLGCEGFGTASIPALTALVYDPKTHCWSEAGQSDIPRMYHSVALMLLDGTILVAGSNPNEMPILEEDIDPAIPARAYPTEFRVEKYTPSYLLEGKANLRPQNIKISETVLVPGEGASTITFTSTDEPQDFKVLLYHGGFVTHAAHMGQVLLEMEHLNLRPLGRNRYRVSVRVPDIKIAPGPYVVYVVVNGVPGVGQFVSVQTGEGGSSR